MLDEKKLLACAFSNTLKKFRLRQSLSQEALALLSGVDRSCVSAVERGQRNITISTLGRLLPHLDSNYRHFFDDVALEIQKEIKNQRSANLEKYPFLELEDEPEGAFPLQKVDFEAFQAMVGGLTHEINNAIAVIKARIELLRKNLQDYPGENVLRHLNQLEDSTSQIVGFIKSFEVFFKLPGNQDATISPKELWASAVQTLEQELAERKIEVTTSFQNQHLKTYFDYRLLTDALQCYLEQSLYFLRSIKKPEIYIKTEESKTDFSILLKNNAPYEWAAQTGNGDGYFTRREGHVRFSPSIAFLKAFGVRFALKNEQGKPCNIIQIPKS